jgi:hypothetical protein
MSDDESSMLHSSLVWDQDGHLSDIAQNAIADAESALLPRAACEHAEACESCLRSIGQIAQFSLEIDSALKGINAGYLPQRSVAQPARAPRQWPVTELGLALVLALLGQLPTLQALNPAGIRHSMKAVVHVSVQVLQHIAGTSFGAALPWVSASMLVAISGSIAYAARRGLAHDLGRQLSSPPSQLR